MMCLRPRRPLPAACCPGAFSDDLIRWAKFPPSLADEDLAPYLYLAASFSGKPCSMPGYRSGCVTSPPSSCRASARSRRP